MTSPVVENPLRSNAVNVEGRNGKVTKKVDNGGGCHLFGLTSASSPFCSRVGWFCCGFMMLDNIYLSAMRHAGGEGLLLRVRYFGGLLDVRLAGKA